MASPAGKTALSGNAARLVVFFSGRLIALLLVLYLAFLFFSNIAEVRRFPWRMNPPVILLSWALLLLEIFLGAFFLRLLLSQIEERISMRKTFRGLALSNLYKYLPGGVWAGLSLLLFLEREQVPRKKILFVTVGYYALGLTGGLMAVAIIGAVGGAGLLPGGVGGSIFILAPLLFVAVPLLLRGVSRFVGVSSLRVDFSMVLVGCFTFSWLLLGFAFSLLARGLSPSVDLDTPSLIGTILVAWLGGIAIFIVPGGLGVREGILTGLLALHLPLPVAAALSLCTRLWTMAADAAAGIIAWRI